MIVEIAPLNNQTQLKIQPNSYLVDSSDIVYEVGIRAFSELPKDLVQSLPKSAQETDPNVKIQVIWACALANTRHKKLGQADGTSAGTKYPAKVLKLNQRLWKEAKVYHPESLKESQAKNPKWLKAMQGLGDDYTAVEIGEVMDYVFGNAKKEIPADAFWKDKLRDADALAKHFPTLRDRMHNERRKIEEASAPKPPSKPAPFLMPNERVDTNSNSIMPTMRTR